MEIVFLVIGTLVFAFIGPVLGCLLAGLDRIISAKLQGRVGPPLLQPYYDVRKLLEKEHASVNTSEGVYVTLSFVFTLLAGGVFFGGGSVLLSIFIVTLSSLFFISAAYSVRSPFSEAGANREVLQVMAYEPMLIFLAVGFYMALGSFNVSDLFTATSPIITQTWLIFVGFLFVLTIKLRKSPFDLSSAQHAHQELVQGITTEMSGKTLAKVEVMHWCENVLFLGWVAMFFIWGNPISWAIAVVLAFLIYLLEIFIDNNFARVKWQFLLKSAWIVALVAGGVNMFVLAYM